jgi:hypothetical protein
VTFSPTRNLALPHFFLRISGGYLLSRGPHFTPDRLRGPRAQEGGRRGAEGCGFESPASRGEARHLHAPGRRGAGCGSHRQQRRGLAGGSCSGCGNGGRAAGRDPRRRRSGAVSVRPRPPLPSLLLSLRPSLPPGRLSGSEAKPWVPMATRRGGGGGAAGGACPARSRVVSRGLAGLLVPRGPPARRPPAPTRTGCEPLRSRCGQSPQGAALGGAGSPLRALVLGTVSTAARGWLG